MDHQTVHNQTNNKVYVVYGQFSVNSGHCLKMILGLCLLDSIYQKYNSCYFTNIL